MSEEYGYAYRRISGPTTRWIESVPACVDLGAAQAHVAAIVTERPGHWEAKVTVRTKAGPWRDYEPPGEQPDPGDSDDLAPQVLSDLLLLVKEQPVPPEVIATWTPAEREEAARWAAGVHLSASGVQVRVTDEPALVARAAELASSPVLAQLAVEGWMQAKARLERSAAACAEDLLEDTEPLVQAAQDAITGLLVLLRERERA